MIYDDPFVQSVQQVAWHANKAGFSVQDFAKAMNSFDVATSSFRCKASAVIRHDSSRLPYWPIVAGPYLLEQPMTITDRQTPYSYGWHGNCDPGAPLYGHFHTFSVACFQWLPKRNGGIKRGPCIVRVSGPVSRPDLVYAKATEICNQLSANSYIGPKNVRA